ncbi:putative Autophagy protein Apg6 [Paratrimastix pyriformis]|uniref:Autophagy protein Apg6 n=1 Tax=Paratrimastix pyriformis TaxID=342808 RepID=A0ABQ8UEJ9_9EUKA|nr:putative Autophagy protein Apg6 [Paratrimastix pyriformis]
MEVSGPVVRELYCLHCQKKLELSHSLNAVAALNQKKLVGESSYIVVGEKPQPLDNEPLQANIDTEIARLLDEAALTRLDHPLCQDCIERLKREFLKQVKEAEEDTTRYQSCLEELEAKAAELTSPPGDAATSGAPTSADASLEALQAELRRVCSVAPSHTNTRMILGFVALTQVDEERRRLEAELEQTEADMHQVTGQRRKLEEQEATLAEKGVSTEPVQRSHAAAACGPGGPGCLRGPGNTVSRHLQQLERTGLLEDAFVIDPTGPMINGIRLGEAPDIKWPEKNAALGMCVFALQSLYRACGFVKGSVTLIPRGSFSRLRYNDEDHAFFETDRFLRGWAKLNTALQYYLLALGELSEYLRRRYGYQPPPTGCRPLAAMQQRLATDPRPALGPPAPPERSLACCRSRPEDQLQWEHVNVWASDLFKWLKHLLTWVERGRSQAQPVPPVALCRQFQVGIKEGRDEEGAVPGGPICGMRSIGWADERVGERNVSWAA